MKWLFNWEVDVLFSAKTGFILQDSLISIFIVIITMLILFQTIQMKFNVHQTLVRHRQNIWEKTYDELSQIEECEKKCLEPNSEENEDI